MKLQAKAEAWAKEKFAGIDKHPSLGPCHKFIQAAYIAGYKSAIADASEVAMDTSEVMLAAKHKDETEIGFFAKGALYAACDIAEEIKKLGD